MTKNPADLAALADPCWMVVQPWPGEDLRKGGGARACPRFTIHHAPRDLATQLAKLLGLYLDEMPQQVGLHRLGRCEQCTEPDDDTTKPPRREIDIFTPKDWAPSTMEGA